MTSFLSIDVRLLFAVCAGLAGATAVLYMWLGLRYPQAGPLRMWGLGLLLLLAANTGYALRHIAPPIASIVLANMCALSALVVFRAGAMRLSGQRSIAFDAPGWSIVILVGLLLSWFAFVMPDLGTRVLIVCLAAALLSARIASQLSSYAQRAPSRLPAAILAGLWWFVVAVFLITSLATVIYGEYVQDLLQAGSALTSLFHVRPLLFILIGVFALWTQLHALHREKADALDRAQARALAGAAAFAQRCDALIARHPERPLAVALVEADEYDAITNRHGYEAGEALTDWVQGGLERVLGADALEYHGKAQFAVLLAGADKAAARGTADEMRRQVQSGEIKHDGQILRTTLSIGIAMLQPDRMTAKALTAAARVAVYQARAGGRNRVAHAADPLADLSLGAEPEGRLLGA